MSQEEHMTMFGSEIQYRQKANDSTKSFLSSKYAQNEGNSTISDNGVVVGFSLEEESRCSPSTMLLVSSSRRHVEPLWPQETMGLVPIREETAYDLNIENGIDQHDTFLQTPQGTLRSLMEDENDDERQPPSPISRSQDIFRSKSPDGLAYPDLQVNSCFTISDEEARDSSDHQLESSPHSVLRLLRQDIDSAAQPDLGQESSPLVVDRNLYSCNPCGFPNEHSDLVTDGTPWDERELQDVDLEEPGHCNGILRLFNSHPFQFSKKQQQRRTKEERDFSIEQGGKRRRLFNTVRERIQSTKVQDISITQEPVTKTSQEAVDVSICQAVQDKQRRIHTACHGVQDIGDKVKSSPYATCACLVVVFVTAFLVALLVAFQQFDKEFDTPIATTTPPPPPSLSPTVYPSPSSPSDVFSSTHSERFKIVGQVFENHGILLAEHIQDDPKSPQALALAWLSDSLSAHFLNSSHVNVDDWTSHEILRPLVEQYALHVLYFSTNGWEWNHDVGWEGETMTSTIATVSSSPCDMYGVSCLTLTAWSHSQQRFHYIEVVSGLELNNNSLEGTLPLEVNLLRNLEELNLSQNQLKGKIPGSFKSLLSLDLSENQLSGSLGEHEIKHWSMLQTLKLAGNAFEGTIPSTIGHLSNLEQLSLGHNKFAGSIPETISSLTHLDTLELQHNGFTGHIPSTMSALKSLQNLNLGNNKLKGTIPPLLFRLTTLQEGHLEFNTFTGTIPPFPLKNNLKRLVLDNNHLNGTIPESMTNLLFLEELSLQNNELSGNISALSSLQHLQDLRLASNQLTGEIPSELGNSLEVLFVEGNLFGGSIPSELGLLSNLTSVRFHLNNLTGAVPEKLCRLVQDGNLEHVSADCDGPDAPLECSCCNYCY